MEEVGQGNNAMVIDDARCDGLAESEMDKHLTHLLFHVGGVVGQKFHKEGKICEKVKRVM